MKTPSSSSCHRIRSSKSWRARKSRLMRRPEAFHPYGNSKKSFEKKGSSTSPLPPVHSATCDECPHCGAKSSLEFDDESAVCVECASRILSHQVFLVPNNYLGKNNGRYTTKKHMYERLVYFKQIINDVRGERHGRIPATIEAKLKERLTGVPCLFITPQFVTLTLKRMKLSKYNYHRVNLATQFSGGYYKPSPVQHRHWRVFLYLFQRIERVYPAVCKKIAPKRKIFFNYSYLFTRFCQLVGRLDYCAHVPRLRGVSARVVQGRLWRAVCARINLPWHPDIP
jgi:DNA-directed RNA polymerase subunit RPC12/RpoP